MPTPVFLHLPLWTQYSNEGTYSGVYFSCQYDEQDNRLSYRRETALQGMLVLAKSGRLELGDNILRIL